jgi:hypothetical protein
MNMTHERFQAHREDFGHGPQRVDNIRARLEEERKVYRSLPRDSYDERIVAANITDLEQLLGYAERNEEARAQQEQERQDAQAAKMHERRAADDAALKAELHTKFFGANPTASEEDFERLLPSLRDEHLLERSRTAMEKTRASIGRFF